MNYIKPAVDIIDARAIKGIETVIQPECHCTMAGSRVHYGPTDVVAQLPD